jgi:hypothetical protein
MIKNLKSLLPTDKFDTERAESLKAYSFEEVEPIFPQILEWLQDGNWPVARPVGEFVLSLPQDKTGPYLMQIMNGKEYDWKYFLISMFGREDKEKMYPQLLLELERLANHPTEVEVACELQWMAQQIV